MKKYNKFVEEYQNRGYYASIFGEEDGDFTIFDINNYIVTVFDMSDFDKDEIYLWIEVEKEDGHERLVEKSYKNVKSAINMVDRFCK